MSQSNRIRRVQAPIIPVVATMIRETPGTISLGQGVVSYGPPAPSFEQLRRFHERPELHKYQAVYGIPELLEGLETKLQRDNGLRIDRQSRLIVTAGGNMAFVNALLAIADPGDEVILQLPYYFNHEMAIAMANCRAVLVPTDLNSQLQPQLIEQAITSRTRAIVTISPNNPTGAVYAEGALRDVNEMCRRRGIYHISDEAYEYFTYGGARHFSPGSIEGAAGHTISLFSFSKSFGMASWRVGYMVVPAGLFEAINKIQDTVLICPPVISQFAAIGALEAGRSYCMEKLPGLEEARGLVLRAVEELGDSCEVPAAEGAFYFFLRLKSRLSSMSFVERLVREHRVAVIPGSAFGLEDGCQLRVSYGALDSESVSEGVGRLVQGIRTILQSEG